MKYPLYLIGLTPGSLEPPQNCAEIISGADILSGGKRLLEQFPEFGGKKIPFTCPLINYANELKDHLKKNRKVVLLADGDPMFFGIGKRLVPLLGRDNIKIIPSVSTIQIGLARLGLGWEDVRTVSLHGREDYFPLYSALQQGQNCAVFTDEVNTPSAIAQNLLEKGIESYSMTVLADLNTDSEVITKGSLESFTDFICSDLNIVILSANETAAANKVFGREDDLFNRQKGLITKLPIRATGLAILDLRKNQIVWDLGAGCGSVAIEGSFVAGDSRFYAVEKDAARFEMIKQNIQNFKAWTVEPVCAAMPQALEDLPDPDRIFMGGGIGMDDSVIKEAASRLLPGGRIVVHAILMGSIQRTRETFEGLGWNWQAMQMQSSHSEPLAGDIRYKAHNPVTIIWADKPLES
jgi:precorrin-6Y C5,15-methyltransferase (decarboxylating)